MISRIVNFFSRKKIKKYGVSTLPATEGSNDKLDLHCDAKIALSKMVNQEALTNNDVNNILQYVDSTIPYVPPGVFTLNDYMSKIAVFDIADLELVEERTKAVLTLKEISHNINMTITIDAKDFAEMFTSIKPRKE